MTDPVALALTLSAESEDVDFKREFDPTSAGEWCELVKDIVAMANSGGGTIVIGLESDGSLASAPPIAAMGLDQATVVDKVAKYTATNLSAIRIERSAKSGQEILALVIGACSCPLPFCSPGTYALPDGKQKTAFGRGTVYFRHGSKSEPATAEDLRGAFDRQLLARREEWLGNIRRVVEAPEGSVVSVLPAEIAPPGSTEAAVKVRLVHDPSAQAVPHWNPDDTHPHRQKELVNAVKAKLPAGVTFNQYDVQCLRRAHDLDSNPNFTHHPKFGSCQFSPALVEWLVESFQKNPAFFQEARERFRPHA